MPGWEDKPECHSIVMAINRIRFNFLNRKRTHKRNNLYDSILSISKKVCDVVVLHIMSSVSKTKSFLSNMQLQKKETRVVTQMIHNNGI